MANFHSTHTPISILYSDFLRWRYGIISRLFNLHPLYKRFYLFHIYNSETVKAYFTLLLSMHKYYKIYFLEVVFTRSSNHFTFLLASVHCRCLYFTDLSPSYYLTSGLIDWLSGSLPLYIMVSLLSRIIWKHDLPKLFSKHDVPSVPKNKSAPNLLETFVLMIHRHDTYIKFRQLYFLSPRWVQKWKFIQYIRFNNVFWALLSLRDLEKWLTLNTFTIYDKNTTNFKTKTPQILGQKKHKDLAEKSVEVRFSARKMKQQPLSWSLLSCCYIWFERFFIFY